MNRIQLEGVLTAAEYARIDEFCRTHSGVEQIPHLAKWLEAEFGVLLCLDPDVITGFQRDSSNLPGQATGIVRPVSERECAALLRAGLQARIPVTVSGGRTNLTGSATPPGGIILSTANWLAPSACVDSGRHLVTAPVGMFLEDMRRQVLLQSTNQLIFPVDPTSRGEASVGGAMACNASGFTPGETGAFRAWVDRIRFLLPNGYAVAAQRGQYIARDNRFVLVGPAGEQEWPLPYYSRPSIKNASGPCTCVNGAMDFVDLVIGSEGIFGLISACTLRLAPRPPEYLDLFFSLPTETDALVFLQRLRARHNNDLSGLTACEYFGMHCRRYMKHEARFFHGTDPVGIYLQIPLWHDSLEQAAETWLALLLEADCHIKEDAILLLDSDALRVLFMEARHSMPANAIEVVQHRGTFTIMTDTVVPPARFAEFLTFAHDLLRREHLDYLTFGHLGDCHLHFTILPEKTQVEQGVGAYDAIVAKSAELGGVYSGEHGTGKRKRADFLRCYGPDAAAQIRRCKAAVDPYFLLNRGNVIETV